MRRAVRPVAREPALAALVVAATAVYATYSIVRHETFHSTGFDLGIFDQVVRHYSHFEAPASSIRGFEHQLGDHFSPVHALFAPAYWIWADPTVLLLGQAVLVSLSAVPVYLFAAPKLGRFPALLVSAAYLLFWGVQSAIEFDYHEVAFAPLPIALAILFADRRRWLPFFLSLAFLLLVKEDLSLLIAAFGVYLVTLGEYRRGAVTFGAGVAWFFLATEVLMPQFSGPPGGRFWTYTQLGPDALGALENVVRDPLLPFRVLVEPRQKLETIGLLFGAFLGLTLCSRLAILTVPLIAERMLSTNDFYWRTDLHYSLTIAPVLAMGAVAGLAFLLERLPALRARRRAVAVATAGAMLAVAVAISFSFPLHTVVYPDFYDTRRAYRSADRALALIPGGTSVAATNCLIPHLERRDHVGLLGFISRPPDYLVLTVEETDADCLYSIWSERGLRRSAAGARPFYRTEFASNGLLLLRRR